MKMPSFAAGAGGGSLAQGLLAQVDKILAALAVILAGFILWSGIETIRTKSVSRERSPGVISDSVEQARRHMQSGAAPPDDLIPAHRPLEQVVAEWNLPEPPPQESVMLFNRPLFGELAARSKPDVLPIERLLARPGVAVFAARPTVRPVEKEEPPEKEGGSRRARRPNPGQSPSAPEEMLSAGPGVDPYGMAMAGGAPMEMPGRVVPYVLVTGLIPYRKQFEEYAERFQFASFTNPQLDRPNWGPFSIERAEVDEDGKPGDWKRIDPRDIQARARREWVNVQKETFPETFLLPSMSPTGIQPAREPSFSSYCLPLPLLAQGRWDLESVHPWFLDPLSEIQARAKASTTPGAPGVVGGMPMEMAPGFGPGGFGPGGFGPGGFGPGGFGPGGSPMMNEEMLSSPAGAYPGGEMQPGGSYPGMSGAPDSGMMGGGMFGPGMGMSGEDGEEYRLFRFLDTDVEPDKAYAYRVRLAVRNPNLGVPARYLKDAALATAPWLISEHSQPSEAAVVPSAVKILARTLLKDGAPDSLKDLKIRDGAAELLVLAESRDSGRLTLRSIVAEPGGVLDVEPALNKSGGPPSAGDPVKTGAVLLDLRGNQLDRTDEREKAKGRSKGVPPEPLEALVLEPDGEDGFTFRVVGLVESEHAVDTFRRTLPPEVSSSPTTMGVAGGAVPYSP
jgi:hypothetical protein